MQARTQPLQHVEAAARQLDAALEVDDAQRLAQLPVRPRLEVEAARRALAAHHHVVAVVLADRHAGQRQVGNAAHRVEQLLVDDAQPVVQDLDLVADAAHLRFQRLGFGALAVAHELADALALSVATGLQFLDLRQQLPAFLVQRQRLVHRRLAVLQRRHLLPDEIRCLADYLDIEHVCVSCLLLRIAYSLDVTG